MMEIGVGAKAIGRWLLAKVIFAAIVFASWVVGVVVLYHDRKLARRLGRLQRQLSPRRHL